MVIEMWRGDGGGSSEDPQGQSFVYIGKNQWLLAVKKDTPLWYGTDGSCEDSLNGFSCWLSKGGRILLGSEVSEAAGVAELVFEIWRMQGDEVGRASSFYV